MSDINSWDIFYLKMARLMSTKSKDPSTQTGAVIVRPDKSVCSVGFNGFAKGMRDDHSLYENRDTKYSRIIHCEMNAILLSKDTSHVGYTLYTWPFCSCDRCSVHMIQAGIKRFVFPALPADKSDRWKTNIDLAQSYMREAGCEVNEIPCHLLEAQPKENIDDFRSNR